MKKFFIKAAIAVGVVLAFLIIRGIIINVF